MNEYATLRVTRDNLRGLQEIRDELAYLARQEPACYPWYTPGQRVTIDDAIHHLRWCYQRNNAPPHVPPPAPLDPGFKEESPAKSRGKSRSRKSREVA